MRSERKVPARTRVGWGTKGAGEPHARQPTENRRGRAAATWPLINWRHGNALPLGYRPQCWGHPPPPNRSKPEGTARIRRRGPEPRRTLSNGRPPACRDHEGQVLLHRHSREGPRGVREVLHDPLWDEGARPKHGGRGEGDRRRTRLRGRGRQYPRAELLREGQPVRHEVRGRRGAGPPRLRGQGPRRRARRGGEGGPSGGPQDEGAREPLRVHRGPERDLD